MPLRGFLYFADLYKKHIRDIDLSVSRQIRIPAPQYIVFYNGLEKEEEEFVQKLSDAFEEGREGCMELTVRVININHGHNKELMSKCKSLADYAAFVNEVRNNLECIPLQDAVERAIDTCIEQGVLKEFLLEQKAEVIAMSIYEYNEEYVKKVLFEDGMELGYSRGFAEGQAKAREEGQLLLLHKLVYSGMLTMEAAANTMSMSVQELEELMRTLG